MVRVCFPLYPSTRDALSKDILYNRPWFRYQRLLSFYTSTFRRKTLYTNTSQLFKFKEVFFSPKVF